MIEGDENGNCKGVADDLFAAEDAPMQDSVEKGIILQDSSKQLLTEDIIKAVVEH